MTQVYTTPRKVRCVQPEHPCTHLSSPTKFASPRSQHGRRGINRGVNRVERGGRSDPARPNEGAVSLVEARCDGMQPPRKSRSAGQQVEGSIPVAHGRTADPLGAVLAAVGSHGLDPWAGKNHSAGSGGSASPISLSSSSVRSTMPRFSL